MVVQILQCAGPIVFAQGLLFGGGPRVHGTSFGVHFVVYGRWAAANSCVNDVYILTQLIHATRPKTRHPN